MNRETISPAEARAALDSAGAARAQLAALGNCPPWRHAAFGAVMGLLILGLGFPIGVQAACMCLAMGVMVVIVANDRRRYGVFINGYRRGADPSRDAAILLGMIGADRCADIPARTGRGRLGARSPSPALPSSSR